MTPDERAKVLERVAEGMLQEIAGEQRAVHCPMVCAAVEALREARVQRWLTKASETPPTTRDFALLEAHQDLEEVRVERDGLRRRVVAIEGLEAKQRARAEIAEADRGRFAATIDEMNRILQASGDETPRHAAERLTRSLFEAVSQRDAAEEQSKALWKLARAALRYHREGINVAAAEATEAIRALPLELRCALMTYEVPPCAGS